MAEVDGVGRGAVLARRGRIQPGVWQVRQRLTVRREPWACMLPWQALQAASLTTVRGTAVDAAGTNSKEAPTG